MGLGDEFRLDKSALRVCALTDPDDAKEFWWRQSPDDRLRAMEFLRQVAYGYDPTTARLEGVLEVVQRPRR